MQDQHKNRGQHQHGQDQGQMPNRNRSNVQEMPEPVGKIGGQGMGQGGGMNSGEGSARTVPSENGPDDTAEPDGQFPDDDPKVGTMRAAGEDPVSDMDPNAEGASLAEDPDGIEKVAGLSREAQWETKRPGVEQDENADFDKANEPSGDSAKNVPSA